MSLFTPFPTLYHEVPFYPLRLRSLGPFRPVRFRSLVRQRCLLRQDALDHEAFERWHDAPPRP